MLRTHLDKESYMSLICFKCELKPHTTNETNFLEHVCLFPYSSWLILPTVVGGSSSGGSGASVSQDPPGFGMRGRLGAVLLTSVEML